MAHAKTPFICLRLKPDEMKLMMRAQELEQLKRTDVIRRALSHYVRHLEKQAKEVT